MSDSDKTVQYTVEANADGFVASMGKAREAAVTSAKGVEAAFAGLGGVFKSLQASFGGILAIFAGGAAFAGAVNATKEWGAETGKLSKQLQVTTAEATAYQVAAKKLGIENGAIVDASDKMAKSLAKGEDAYKTLGIETRNANGSFRSTGELLPEVMDRLRGITNVTEQNVAGVKIFGKGWSEARSLLKVSSEEMAAARQKVRDLNLEVDPAAVRKYQAAINDIKLIVTSLSIQVGNVLLPVLTELGVWFGQVGPYVVGAFGVALKVVQSTLTAVWGVIKGVVQGVTGVVAALVEAIQGNYSKAWGILKDAGATAFDSVAEGFNAAAAVWDPKIPKPRIEKGDGGKHLDFAKEGDGTEKSRVSVWESQLETAKAAIERQGLLEGQYRQRSLADNLAFYAELLQRKDLNETEKTQLTRKAAEVEMASIRETFAERVKTLEAEAARFKNNIDERIRLEVQIQSMYAAGTKEFAATQEKINALQREASAQAKAVAQARVDTQRQATLATLQLEEQTLQQAERLQLVSHEQVLTQHLQFEERRNSIALEALRQRLQAAEADPDRNPVEIARIHTEIEALEQQHQLRMAKIKGDLQGTQLEPLVNTYKAAEVALGNAITGILTRTQTLGQAMRSVWQGISQTIIGEISKILAKKAAAWAVERALTLAGIGAKASEAGAGAASSVASIPYVGPILAIAALASVMGAVMGAKSSVPSAARGYDIPAGVNPMTQLHEREMVLPAKHADVIRAMADGDAGGGMGGHTINYHDNTGSLTPAAIRDNVQVIARELARLDRQFFKPNR
jgi:hypothetical protein